MAEVLVLVDSLDGKVKKPTLELLTAARQLGDPSAVVIGAAGTAEPLSNQLAEFGAAKVYVVESDELASYPVAPKAEALAVTIHVLFGQRQVRVITYKWMMVWSC